MSEDAKTQSVCKRKENSKRKLCNVSGFGKKSPFVNRIQSVIICFAKSMKVSQPH